MQEAPLTFESMTRAFEAFERHHRAHQAVLRRLADMRTLGPGAIGQELHRARRLRQRDPESAVDLISVHAE